MISFRKVNGNCSKWGLVAFILGLLWLVSLCGILDNSPTSSIRFAEAAFFALTLWLLWFALIRRLWVGLLCALPAVLVWPLEAWVRTDFGTPISVHFVALVLETNWAEGANFLSAYGLRLAAVWMIWLALYTGAIWVAYRHRLSWTHRSRAWCLAILLPSLALFYWSWGTPRWIMEDDHATSAFEGSSMHGWSQQWADVFPLNLLISVQEYELEQNKIQGLRHALARQSMGGRLLSSERAPNVVVLVVGESATATHWSLLGYGKKTTPQLDTQANLVAFSNVVSLSTATRSAVPGVLSRRPVLWPDGHVDAKAEPSLIKVFGEAGYQTHWISNQSPLGKYDTSISVYAREAQDVRFLNPSTYSHESSLDEILLRPLDSILNTPGRHFIVLHTLGSHFNYVQRYPHAYDRFSPSLNSAGVVLPDSKEYSERVDNSYDNSVLYTDHVLSEVVKTVNKHGGSSMVAYFSDHGVDPATGPCPAKGASRRGEAAFRVPVFFWLSESMRMQRSEQWAELQANTHESYMTRAMFSTLLELTGVDIAGNIPTESFLRRPDLKVNPRHVANADAKLVDFDVARQKNACFIAPY